MANAFSFRPPLRLIGLLALVSLVAGCDASKAPSSAPSKSTRLTQSAAQVCNGALDAATASDLREVSGAQDFTSEVLEKRKDIATSMKRELPVPSSDGFGNPHYACLIAWHNVGVAKPPISITMEWATKPAAPTWTSPDDATAYDVADGAWSSVNGAYIYFRCPVKGEERQQASSHTRIRAYLKIYDSPNKRQIREAMLNILHTFSVELAQSLGCLNTGNLPKELGKVKGYPVKAG